jgi:hypothetical protein
VAGKYQLTDLGFEIVDAGRQADAKVRAFLNVELFKRTYDEFRGKLLPPRPHGLEAAFVNFGVTSKNSRTARLAFEKSARMAGLYPNGNEDRLVMPFGGAAPVAAEPSEPAIVEAAGQVGSSSASAVSLPGIHKSILGMLDELPPPKTQWSKAEQADWLDAMATLFQVIYKSEGGGEVAVTFTP